MPLYRVTNVSTPVGYVPLQEVWQRIESRYDGFSPQLRRAARFVRENPQEVALNSLRSVAAYAGVSPAAVTRLLQALDFRSWEAFQSEHRAWLTTEKHGVFSGRAGRLISGVRQPGAEDALLDRIVSAEASNLHAALDTHLRPRLRDAADLIATAPSIAIAGLRSCFPVAFSLHYALSLFTPRARLMSGAGGGLLDDLHYLRENDALIVISVLPYSRETVEAARLAREAGVRVVGITDGPLTPVARLSDVALIAANESPAHIASPIGPIIVAQALATLVLARSGRDALDTLRRREATLEAISAYLPEETSNERQ